MSHFESPFLAVSAGDWMCSNDPAFAIFDGFSVSPGHVLITTRRIFGLRALHRALDLAVLTAYAWRQPGPDGPAIELGHDFHQVETLPENDRARYTITLQACKDLLTRLLKLNHARAAEETSAQAAQTPSTKGIKPKKLQRNKQEDELI